MGKRIYGMIMSLDGYVGRARAFWLRRPEDQEVHSFVNQQASSVGTYLYGWRIVRDDDPP